jgi:hypothetical protein
MSLGVPEEDEQTSDIKRIHASPSISDEAVPAERGGCRGGARPMRWEARFRGLLTVPSVTSDVAFYLAASYRFTGRREQRNVQHSSCHHDREAERKKSTVRRTSVMPTASRLFSDEEQLEGVFAEVACVCWW